MSWLLRGFLGGVAFLAVFGLRLTFIPSRLYHARDDGVITMSVGRHLAEYGFIGVSPSGPIVEASSSPLQTLFYYLAYLINGIGYSNYSTAQTWVFVFLLGFVISHFFFARPGTVFILSVLAAMCLSVFYPFLLWHASGMENALNHVFLLATVLCLFKMVRDEKILFVLVIIPLSASFVRFEAILHISMLLLVFSFVWFRWFNSLQGLVFSCVVIALWAAGQTAHFFYFNDLVPNTAYGQRISLGARILGTLNGELFVEGLRNAMLNALFQGWVVLAVLPVLWKGQMVPTSLRFLFYCTLTLLLGATANMWLFGAPRIDLPRTTTQITPVVMACLFAFASIHDRQRQVLLRSSALAVAVVGFALLSGQKPYYLGWETKSFNAIREKFVKLAEEHDIERPLISNPDLGVMSWHKQFNILDLGYLGSPVFAKLGSKSRAEYLLRFAQPDFIEAHGPWTTSNCEHLFLNPDFVALYLPVEGHFDNREMCQPGVTPKETIWVRRDIMMSNTSRERTFLSELQNNLSPGRIATELALCRGQKGSCTYVTRTVFRFIPELRRDALFEDVISLFNDPLSRAYLTGWRNPQAHRVIVEYFANASDS